MNINLLTRPYIANPNAFNGYSGNNADIAKNIVKNDEGKQTITLKYIIENKPKTKIIRKYMSEQIKAIKSPEELLFESSEDN